MKEEKLLSFEYDIIEGGFDQQIWNDISENHNFDPKKTHIHLDDATICEGDGRGVYFVGSEQG